MVFPYSRLLVVFVRVAELMEFGGSVGTEESHYCDCGTEMETLKKPGITFIMFSSVAIAVF